MSSPAALATVTATLQHLLSGVSTLVTTQSPGVARTGTGEQLNIFLYSTHISEAFRYAPLPRETRSGESGQPPLPLVLKYVITAYGANDDDISGQQLMGHAMSVLHDHPLLGPADIIGITPDSGLQDQLERIRITPDTLSLDEISKLWTSFQSAEYRLSTGYEVSVVLIESTRPSRTPLPVLRRGVDDLGPEVTATAPATLYGLRFANQKPSAEFGDTVTLLGSHLNSDNADVRFSHPQLAAPIDLAPQIGKPGAELAVQLPTVADDPQLPSNWPAGFYSVQLFISPEIGTPRTSNRVAMPLSPRIESINPASAPAGDVVLTIECLPQVRQEQDVLLLFGERMITPDSISTPPDPTANSVLTFTVTGAVARALPYTLRLRVNGVDSIPVDFSGSVPQFAASQQVTIT